MQCARCEAQGGEGPRVVTRPQTSMSTGAEAAGGGESGLFYLVIFQRIHGKKNS